MYETSTGLLLRAVEGDSLAWERLDALYRPLIRRWLIGQGVHPQEADDLTQDVLLSAFRGLERFRHEGRVGSFRKWLRTITANRVRERWRAGGVRVEGRDRVDLGRAADELEDPASERSAAWDREYEADVLRRLLALVEGEFDPATLRAFGLLALEGRKGAEVAADLGMSVAAVYAAKSRVLRRLRDEGRGLLD